MCTKVLPFPETWGDNNSGEGRWEVGLGSRWPKIILVLNALGRQKLQGRELTRGKPALILVSSLSASPPQLPLFFSVDAGNLNLEASLSWMLDCIWLPAFWQLSGRWPVIFPRPDHGNIQDSDWKLFPLLALWRSPCYQLLIACWIAKASAEMGTALLSN